MVRVLIVGGSACAIMWAAAALPAFWSQRDLAHIAGRVLAGEPYRPQVLDAVEQRFDVMPSWAYRAAALNRLAVLQLRRLEEAMFGGAPGPIDSRLDELGRVVGESLAGTPSDPFLWMVLFWLENTRDGFGADHLGALRLSYRLGPREGWVAIKRNRLAMAVFSTLPAELAQAAISEFANLVHSRMYDEAAAILVGPGWPIRDRLIKRVYELDGNDGQAFAKVLHMQNVTDAAIPDTASTPLRPWQ